MMLDSATRYATAVRPRWLWPWWLVGT